MEKVATIALHFSYPIPLNGITQPAVCHHTNGCRFFSKKKCVNSTNTKHTNVCIYQWDKRAVHRSSNKHHSCEGMQCCSWQSSSSFYSLQHTTRYHRPVIHFLFSELLKKQWLNFYYAWQPQTGSAYSSSESVCELWKQNPFHATEFKFSFIKIEKGEK